MKGLESRTISTHLTAEFIQELLDWTLRWSCFFGARSCWGGMQWHVATCNNMQWQIFSNGLNIVHATRIQNLLNFQWIEFICKSLKPLQRCDSSKIGVRGRLFCHCSWLFTYGHKNGSSLISNLSPLKSLPAWDCLDWSVRCFLREFLRSGLCCSRLLGITLFEGWTNGICNVGCQEICCDCSTFSLHMLGVIEGRKPMISIIRNGEQLFVEVGLCM